MCHQGKEIKVKNIKLLDMSTSYNTSLSLCHWSPLPSVRHQPPRSLVTPAKCTPSANAVTGHPCQVSTIASHFPFCSTSFQSPLLMTSWPRSGPGTKLAHYDSSRIPSESPPFLASSPQSSQGLSKRLLHPAAVHICHPVSFLRVTT